MSRPATKPAELHPQCSPRRSSNSSAPFPVPEADEDRAHPRADTQQDIVALTVFLPRRKITTHACRYAIKARTLIQPLCSEDWGDIANFRDWLDKGGTPPSELYMVAEYFQKQ